MLIDPRNGPAFDLPAHTGERRVYLIASLPRTGSTLLCRALCDTHYIGTPKEYVNPVQVRDWEVRLGTATSRWRHRCLRGPALALVGRGPWTSTRRRAHLQRVAQRRTGPDGHFGLKVHHHHWVLWGADVRAVLPPFRWIRVRREDRLAQALSWVRARQTGQWAAHGRAWGRAHYDARAIQRALERIEADERRWDLELRGDAVLTLTYETLVRDLQGSVAAVLDHLGVAHPAPPVSPALAPQADALTAAWRQRWLDETARRRTRR